MKKKVLKPNTFETKLEKSPSQESDCLCSLETVNKWKYMADI